MSPASVHDDGEVNQITFFIDTSLDTRLAAIVSDSDTVSDLKQKIILEHRQCYPDIGDIQIDCLKVKRRGNFYHLSDSMPIKSAFWVDRRKFWYVSVDVSRLEQVGGTQHMDRVTVGDQLALPWVTGSRLINEHDIHAERPLKPVEFKVHEQPHALNEPKKRTREMHNESLLEDASGSEPSLKKKHKTQKLEGNVNLDIDKVKSKDLSDENMTIYKDENFSARDQVAFAVPSSVEDVEEQTCPRKNTETSEKVSVVAMVVDNDILQETPVVTSQKEKNDELVHKAVMENEIPSSPMNLKGSENKEAENEVSSTSPIEKLQNSNADANDKLQHDVSSIGHQSASNRISKHNKDKGEGKKKKKSKKTVRKDKDESLVNNADNIVGDMTSSAVPVPVPVFDEKINDQRNKDNVTAERNEVSEKTVVADHHVGPTVPESVGDQIDDMHKKGKKRKSKRSVAKNKDELLVGPTSSTIPAPVLNEKVIDEKNDDIVGLINDDRIHVSENARNHDSLVIAAKESDVAVKVVEVSKPIESVVEKSVKKVKDVKKSSKKKKDESLVKKDVVKHKEVATVSNEENVLPPSERKESVQIALHGENGRNDDINADLRISGDEKKENQVNDEGVNDNLEKPNEKMNDGTKILEIPKPTEIVEESLPKVVVKDIGRSKKKKKDVVKPKDVATVTNEENRLPPSETKENVEMTSVNALHGECGRNDDVNADVRISGEGKKENQVNAEDVNDNFRKPNDGTKKSRKKKIAKKSAVINENESSKRHSPDPKIGPENVKSVELYNLPEEVVKNVNVSEENHDVINEVDIPNDKSNEIDFKNYFVSSDQPNKPKKKTKELPIVETPVDNKKNTEQDGIATQSQKSCLINETHKVSADVAKESKVHNIINAMKTPTRTRKVATSKSSGQTQVITVKKNPLVVNNSQNVRKSLLNTPGNIFGNDTDESGADDNLAVNSDSSTRTPSRNAQSSSEESASSIDSRRKGSCAVKRKEIGGKNTLSLQSRPKKTSINDLLRSSSRFKKAKLTASKQVEDTESQPVDFVPESQPI